MIVFGLFPIRYEYFESNADDEYLSERSIDPDVFLVYDL